MSLWWEKLPDADNDTATWTQDELKALGEYMAYENLLDFIDSLPKEKEIDLDEEITKYWKDISSIYGAVGKEITRFDFDDVCRYFCELGKNGK